MSLEIHQLPAFDDNYLYVLRDTESGETAAVDPGDAQVILSFLKEKKWPLTKIFITHHHFDHTGGVAALKQNTQAKVFAPKYDEHRISQVDHWVEEGSEVFVGNHQAKVLFLPGHTLGHIAYYFSDDGALFSGDVLFAMGCGRLFEGTSAQMHQSLKKIKALPPKTKVYCAHEYTLANGRFALAVDPENSDLLKRLDDVEKLRAGGQPTIPTELQQELMTNPFLRCDDPSIRKTVDLITSPEALVFAEVRKRKDQF